MENITRDGNGNTEFNLSSEQLELLYQQFATRFRTEEAENKEDVLTAIPAAILSDLKETTASAMEKKLKRYVRNLPHYEDNEWTTSQTINRSFSLSSATKTPISFDTQQKSASELFEELEFISTNRCYTTTFTNVVEKARKLGGLFVSNSKEHRRQLRTLATRAP
ncbi:hypothetical protein AB4K20DRAFT_1950956 [Rhizopus microsporus]